MVSGRLVYSVVSVVLIAVIIVGWAAFGISQVRSPSVYTGQVVDIEVDKGILFRTSQVHLKTHLRSSDSQTFCIHPDNQDEQVQILRDALRNESRVSIEYSRPLWVPINDCDVGLSIVGRIEVA